MECIPILRALCLSFGLITSLVVSLPVHDGPGALPDLPLEEQLKSLANRSTSEHAFIRLNHTGQHQYFPSNAAVIVQGDSSMRLFDHADIDHPSFDPRHFLSMASNETVQPVEVAPVAGQPYFMFIPPAILQNIKPEMARHEVLDLFSRHRVKRHHPSLLQNVLGELQNYALVPIKSNNGKIRYILLKNPKFIIGNVNKGKKPAGPVPAIIQLGQDNKPTSLTGAAPPGTDPTATSDQIQYQNQLGKDGSMHMERFPRPVPLAEPIDSAFNDGSASTPVAAAMTASQNGLSSSSSYSGTSGHSSVSGMQTHSHGGTSGGHTVQKTEVVETVMESNNQQAAAAQQAASSSSASSSQTVSGHAHGDVHGSGAVVETAAAAASKQVAAASSASKQEKTVKKTKKTTTTTVVKNATPSAAGGGGAIQEVKQVVEEAVHHDAAAASASAAESAASGSSAAQSVSGGSSGTVGQSETAAAASSAASSKSESASSTKSVKKITKKTTVVTKKHVAPADGTGSVVSDIGGQGSIQISPEAPVVVDNAGKPPTAILSDNNDKPQGIHRMAALIPTHQPKAAAPIIEKTTSKPEVSTAVTEEREVEPEERMSTTQQPTAARQGRFRDLPAPPSLASGGHVDHLPQGAVGWSGGGAAPGGPTTPEPALGSLDRVNTTDMPEEIEARPDKNAERAEHEVSYVVLEHVIPDVSRPRPLVDLVTLRYAPPSSQSHRNKRQANWYYYFPSFSSSFRSFPRAGPFNTGPSRPYTPRGGGRGGGGAGVAGWSGGPTTPEPALGAHDRVNTTDMPEEVEARPDKTAAERRREYLRKNPRLTDAQIMAMEKRMFAARAKAAANQVDPVQLAPPEYATAPPGGSAPQPTNRKPGARRKPTLKANRRPPGLKPAPGARPNPVALSKAMNGKRPSSSGRKGPAPKMSATVPTTVMLWREPEPGTTPPSNFPTTPTEPPFYDQTARPFGGQSGRQGFRPSRTRKWRPNPPAKSPPRFTTTASWQQNGGGGSGGGHEWQTPRRQRTNNNRNKNNNRRRNRGRATAPPTTPYVTDPLVTVTDPYIPSTPPTRPPPPPPRRRQRPRQRQQRRRNRRRRPADAESEYPPFVPRDPLSRWIYNNMDGEMFEMMFPFFAMG